MLLDLRIRLKWRRDRKHLPLTGEHWELYRILHRDSWRRARRLPDLVHGRSFNDHVQWLKLFDQDERMVQLSDKVGVRSHVEARLGSGHLPTLLQVGKQFDDIDWDALPAAFVVKATNDSGSVVVVPDRSRFDREAARARIERGLRRVTGFELLVEQVQVGAVLADAGVASLSGHDVPWRREYRIDRDVSTRIERNGRTRRFDKLWPRRQPVCAGLCWLLVL